MSSLKRKRPDEEEKYYVDFNDPDAPESTTPDENLIFKGYPIVLQTSNGNILKKLITSLKGVCKTHPVVLKFSPESVKIIAFHPSEVAEVILTIPAKGIDNYYCKTKMRMNFDTKTFAKRLDIRDTQNQTMTWKIQNVSGMHILIDDPSDGGKFKYFEPCIETEIDPPVPGSHTSPFFIKMPVRALDRAVTGLQDEGAEKEKGESSQSKLGFRCSSNQFQFCGKNDESHTYYQNHENELSLTGQEIYTAYRTSFLGLFLKVMAPMKQELSLHLAEKSPLFIQQYINPTWHIDYYLGPVQED